MPKQKTILKEISLAGRGLHTGHNVHLTFKPAAADQGIVFIRIDAPGRPVMKLGDMSVITGGEAGRYSALKNGDVCIYTVEHLVSALAGLGIDNLVIEIDGDEVPGFDGSATEYVKVIKAAGIAELDAPKKFFEIKEPICVSRNGASVMIAPPVAGAEGLTVSYALEYPHPMLRHSVSLVVTPESYEKDIAPCRTFCLKEEADGLLAKGLGQGASTDNTLVFDAQGVVGNKLRFHDEPARHKALDRIRERFGNSSIFTAGSRI